MSEAIIRETATWFAEEHMIRRLCSNTAKGVWVNHVTSDYLLQRFRHHVDTLHQLLERLHQAPYSSRAPVDSPESQIPDYIACLFEILDQSADLANYSMMCADACRHELLWCLETTVERHTSRAAQEGDNG